MELPYVWHPGLHHYGANVEVAGDGTYDVRVDVDPPAFPRHDRKNGDRYGDGVQVVFEGVDVKTDRSSRIRVGSAGRHASRVFGTAYPTPGAKVAPVARPREG